MSTPTPWGTEFLVNTTTTGSQFEPTATALADGSFVVAWTDASASGGDISGYAVRAQVFNADGSMSGTEFLVNTTTTNHQYLPTVTALVGGRFVVAWSDGSASGGDTSGYAIRAQVFNANGTHSGAEFLVNTTVTGNQEAPTITALDDGRFVVAWQDLSLSSGDTDSYAIRAQAFNTDGSKSGAEFLVNTITASYQFQPSITTLADGRFVVVWTDGSASGGDTSATAVRAQVFNADGTKSGAEFLVNSITTNDQYQPSITALADGRFVVAWADTSLIGGDTSIIAVYGQVFNADGSKAGVEFLVNTTINDAQSSPTITSLADGRFVVAWSDGSASGGDTSATAVRAQVFNADGSKSGTEFLVNTTVTSNQEAPTITALADGRFVIAWMDGSASGGDTSLYAVRAQVFDPREAAVQLLGTLGDDDYIGTAWGDTLWGGFGNDSLTGGLGEDMLYGEAGNDHLKGDAGNDRLDGGDGNDSLTGGAGSDGIQGGGGNDTLIGGTSGDAMTGGAGNDVYDLDSLSDLVFEAAGEGTDKIQSALISLDLGSHANVENATLTGSLALNLTGSTVANILVGNSGGNILDAGAGNDTLDGGDGNDTMTGGDGSDIYYVLDAGDVVTETNATASTGGTDTVYSNLAAYSLGANIENGRIMSAGAANLTGNGLNNTLFAGAGNNVLNGGAGNDTAAYDYAGSAVSVSLAIPTAQATGGSGSDTLTAIENLTGSTYNDALTGNSGANTLDGGAGIDTMTGGDGSDTYYVRNIGDVVTETNATASTGGTDMVYSYLAAYTLGANVENSRIMTGGAANLTGNGLNNTLFAGIGNNVLNGDAGTDTASYLYASSAVSVSLAVATAQATGGSGSDTLTAIENLSGSNYNDTLTGNAGVNVLDGGAGIDTMVGGDGSDFYHVRNTGDVVTETNATASTGGTDTVYSYLAAYTLGANVEYGRIMSTSAANLTGNGLNNVLYSGAGNNVINGDVGTDTASYQYAGSGVSVSLAVSTAQATGGSGSDILTAIENLTGSNYNDVLTGSAGANALAGGTGNDVLTGGAGLDAFLFNTALNATTNLDMLTDFSAPDDTIRLENAIFTQLLTPGTLNAANFRASTAGTASDGDDYILYDTDAGALYYDADGNGAGLAVQFASLTGIPAITNLDFFVV